MNKPRLIDANKALKRYQRKLARLIDNGEDRFSDKCMEIRAIMSAIENEPTAITRNSGASDLDESLVVELKQGHWDIHTDEYDCEYMKCSVCGEEFYPVDEDTVDRVYNYCPNCGAKMDEVEND